MLLALAISSVVPCVITRHLSATSLALTGAVLVASALFCRLAHHGAAPPRRIAVGKTVGNWKIPRDAPGYRRPK
jgi:hypothetical protein